MRENHVHLMRGDLDGWFYDAVVDAGESAWDIETSGLDWRRDHIGTCQVATRDRVAIVQVARYPERLRTLLTSAQVLKVFHHAPFDLRFMSYQWKIRARRVACTKIASKVLDPDLPDGEHSLKPVLFRHLGVEITKDQRRSDWLREDLSPEQLRYAAGDVVHLLPLLDHLLALGHRSGAEPLVKASYEYLPTRVALDIRGSGDVFAY